jgi:hypothetical protein
VVASAYPLVEVGSTVAVVVLVAWGGSLSVPGAAGAVLRVRPVWTEASRMNREVAARCSEGYPCLREAELSARRTAASSRRFLSSPWIRRPLVVDGSGIARRSVAAAARFWPTPLEAGGGLALTSAAMRSWMLLGPCFVVEGPAERNSFG